MSNSQWHEDQAHGERALREWAKKRETQDARMRDALELVREAHRHWDAILWPEDKRYVAMLARAIELLGGEP